MHLFLIRGSSRRSQNVTKEVVGEREPKVEIVMRNITESMSIRDRWSEKGHAESRVACRGKASRIVKTAKASRHSWWKQSGGNDTTRKRYNAEKMGAAEVGIATEMSEVGRRRNTGESDEKSEHTTTIH